MGIFAFNETYDEKCLKEKFRQLTIRCHTEIQPEMMKKYFESKNWKLVNYTKNYLLFEKEKVNHQIQLVKEQEKYTDYGEHIFYIIAKLSEIENRLCEEIFEEIKEM